MKEEPHDDLQTGSGLRRRRTEKTLSALRVLMTVDSAGGVWRFAMDLARAMKPRNVDFVFVVLGAVPTEEQQREANALGELVSLPMPLDWMARNEGELTDIPAAIAVLAERYAADIIHLNLPTQAAGLETKRPIVVMSHACVPTQLQALKKTAPDDRRTWHLALNRRGLAVADAVLSPSRSHAELMTATYGQIRNLRVVHYAFSATQDPTVRSGRHGVVAVARRWDETKNGAVLDEIARHIPHPLTVIGSTTRPNGKSLEFRNAFHAGPLPYPETMELLSKAEVFVSPSLYEPFGIASLEAAANRTPLVLADIPIYRELWDGAALFVPPCDPPAYAAAIEKLISERQLREIMAQLASNRATRFTPARQAVAMRAVYDSVVRPAFTMQLSSTAG